MCRVGWNRIPKPLVIGPAFGWIHCPGTDVAFAMGLLVQLEMAFRQGVLVFAQPGALPAKGLEQVITAVRDLDMDDVRAQLAARAAQPTR